MPPARKVVVYCLSRKLKGELSSDSVLLVNRCYYWEHKVLWLS